MHLHQQLIAETEKSTLSILSISGKMICFILEDGYKEKKVMHETRIPPGTYNIVKRTHGRFFDSHKKKWGHKFVPEIAGVPGFSDILIHPGNTVVDTSGCLLTGYGVAIDYVTRSFYITEKLSSPAFLEVYRRIDEAFNVGQAVTITISRELIMT